MRERELLYVQYYCTNQALALLVGGGERERGWMAQVNGSEGGSEWWE